MDSIEEVREFFAHASAQYSSEARWNRGAKLIHAALAVSLAIGATIVALVQVPAAAIILGVSFISAAVMALHFQRDERKAAIQLAEAVAVLAHIDSGLPLVVKTYESKIEEKTRKFGGEG